MTNRAPELTVGHLMTGEGAKQDRGRKSCSIYLRCASGDELAEAIKRALEGREHVVMVG